MSLFLLLTTACVIPPTVDPAPEQVTPAILIDVPNVDPTLAEIAVVPNLGEYKTFDVSTAVTHPGIDAAALRYKWYWDFEPQKNTPLEFFQICGLAAARCLLQPCTKENANDKLHRLLLVISDQDLPPTAQKPFDYAPAAHVDSVQWTIQLKGNCPGK